MKSAQEPTPQKRAALARALLNRLRAQQVTTMVSTHHPELKIYGVETPGVRNASVEFDLDSLAPTYRLVVGLPGRSNALAIASRLGLDSDIIDEARSFVATEELVADDMLDEIQRTRQQIREQQEEIQALRDEIKAKRHTLQARLDDIEDERRDVIREARRKGSKRPGTVRERTQAPEERYASCRDASGEIAFTGERRRDHDGDASGAAWTTAKSSSLRMWSGTPRLGDTVYLETLNSEGEIVEMDDKEAVVRVGSMRVRAKYSDMRKREASEKRESERARRSAHGSGRSMTTKAPQVKSPGMEIDLRGQRVEEALTNLDRYIDAAYLSGLPFGRIIHGKGTGRLRTAVREYMHSHALVSKVIEAKPNEGGSGVTVVHLAPQVSEPRSY